MTARRLEPVDPWTHLLRIPRNGLARVIQAGAEAESSTLASSSDAPRPLRGRWRFMDWVLRIDVEPDRPPVLHRYRCEGESEDGRPCAAQSPVTESFEVAQQWPGKHLRDHQDHRSYAHVVTTPWVMVPKDEL
ncbi:DUF7848 domain-containing protein [Kitasatospora sp. NPDC001574]